MVSCPRCQWKVWYEVSLNPHYAVIGTALPLSKLMTYPDGNQAYGATASCRQFSSGAHELEHATWRARAGDVLLNLYGIYDYVDSGNVRVNANYSVEGAGHVLVALQTQTTPNNGSTVGCGHLETTTNFTRLSTCD